MGYGDRRFVARSPLPARCVLAAALAAGFVLPSAHAAPAGIYTCIDAQGRRITSDRPIADCLDREQRQLNRDGSTRQTIGPVLTAKERAEREAAERRAQQQRAAEADALRRDQNLVGRYPDEAAHRRAREQALTPVRAAVRTTEERLVEIATERKRLADEAEFYKGRPLPMALRQKIDANEATREGQRAAQRNQGAEIDRINALYDAELEQLRKLWRSGMRAPNSGER